MLVRDALELPLLAHERVDPCLQLGFIPLAVEHVVVHLGDELLLLFLVASNLVLDGPGLLPELPNLRGEPLVAQRQPLGVSSSDRGQRRLHVLIGRRESPRAPSRRALLGDERLHGPLGRSLGSRERLAQSWTAAAQAARSWGSALCDARIAFARIAVRVAAHADYNTMAGSSQSSALWQTVGLPRTLR